MCQSAAVADDTNPQAGAHKKPAALATAAVLEVIQTASALQAAILRGAGPDEQAKLRQKAHDVLDAYLDHTAEAATHVARMIDS